MQLPADISHDDVQQWLNNCWFRVGDKVVRYSGFMGDDVHLGYDEAERSVQFKPLEVDIVWPHTGAVNIPGVGALYVQRRVQRQWRRAYTARGLVCRVPGSWDLRRAPAARVLLRLNPDMPCVVKALFDPWYPAAHEVPAVLDGVPSVALNRQIIVVRNKVDRVYYNEEPVGVLSGGGFIADCPPRIERRVSKLIGGLQW